MNFKGTPQNPRPKLRSEKVADKKARNWVKVSLAFLIVIAILHSSYMTYEYVNTHDFKTPIVIDVKFQNPAPRKANELISPVGTKSAGLIKQAYAEEIEATNPYDAKSPKGIAWEINKNKFGVQHWDALEELVFKESGWKPFAQNPNGGACGLFQSYPCQKMGCELWDYECQVNWGTNYIEDRYENPTKALNHWLARVPVDGRDLGHWY